MVKNNKKSLFFKNGTAIKYAYLCYASLIVIVVLAQLFTLDKLVKNSLFLELPGRVFLLSSVISAVFCLPYVLNLKTGRSMRFVSFCLAMLLPILWLVYSFMTISSYDAGLFGTIFANNIASFAVVVIAFVATSKIVCVRGIPSLKKSV